MQISVAGSVHRITGIAGSCELLYVGSGDRACVLQKNSRQHS